MNAWLESRAPEFEQDDPPAPCKLTDLSLGGCYLATASPFPVRTRIILSMKVAGISFRAEGVVLVMHSDLGMGIEFAQTTESQRNDLEKFIQAMTNTNGALPELLVEPEGLDIGEPVAATKSGNGAEDPLLDLFRKRATFRPKSFRPNCASNEPPAQSRRQKGVRLVITQLAASPASSSSVNTLQSPGEGWGACLDFSARKIALTSGRRSCRASGAAEVPEPRTRPHPGEHSATVRELLSRWSWDRSGGR